MGGGDSYFWDGELGVVEGGGCEGGMVDGVAFYGWEGVVEARGLEEVDEGEVERKGVDEGVFCGDGEGAVDEE